MAQLFRQWRRNSDDSDANGNVIRELGYTDAYQLAMHTLDHYRGTVISSRYCPPSDFVHSAAEAPVELKDKICDAVASVVLEQPMLQVGIMGENSKNPRFVRLEQLDLHDHLEWRSVQSHDLETQRLEVLQSQLDTRYTHLATYPGWKVIVLYTPEFLEILYIWNHPHHDGMSGKIFHRHLLQNLNNPVLQSRKTSGAWILNLPKSPNIPPPPEVLSPFPITVPFLLKTAWEENKPYSIFPLTDRHAQAWAPIKVTPFTTGFRTFDINADTVKKVIDACRHRSTTLTGLLHGLVLVSLTSRLPGMKGFASRTPYDMRQVLPSHTPEYPWLDPKETMYNYVSVLDHKFDAELVATIRAQLLSIHGEEETSLSSDLLKTVWSVSARVRQEIKTKLDSGVQDNMISIMKFVSDWRDEQKAEVKKPRYLSWLVTNLGVLDGGVVGEPQGHQRMVGWSIRRAEFVLSAEVPSAALSLSIMTVKGGQMAVTCSWQDCVVDAGLGEHLTGDLERWLNEIGSMP